MSGVSLAAGALAAAAIIGVAVAGAGVASARSVRAAGIADASALAAADAASGLVVGVPCERAADLAHRAGAELTSCTLAGLIATVEVSLPGPPLPAVARSRAGPPP